MRHLVNDASSAVVRFFPVAMATAAAALCAGKAVKAAALEDALRRSFCGELGAHAFVLGQCSHCFGVASVAALALAAWFALAPRQEGARVRR